jgi:hypothetical protein
MRSTEKDTHRSDSRLHYDFLFMPLGLTNTLFTFQFFRQWKRNILFLFDALIIYNRTWEVHLIQLDEIGGIVFMEEFFHFDFVKIIGNGELPILWWYSGIHLSNGLLQMRLMTDIVEAMISLRHYGDVVGGVVEFFFYIER